MSGYRKSNKILKKFPSYIFPEKETSQGPTRGVINSSPKLKNYNLISETLLDLWKKIQCYVLGLPIIVDINSDGITNCINLFIPH